MNDLGSMSHPCCMKAPIANQRLLKMVKLLAMDGPSLWSSMCHSNGLNRLTRNNTTLTPRSRSRSRDNDADAEVREDDAHPDLWRQRLHERKHTRLVFYRLLFHDNNNNNKRNTSNSDFWLVRSAAAAAVTTTTTTTNVLGYYYMWLDDNHVARYLQASLL